MSCITVRGRVGEDDEEDWAGLLREDLTMDDKSDDDPDVLMLVGMKRTCPPAIPFPAGVSIMTYLSNCAILLNGYIAILKSPFCPQFSLQEFRVTQ